MATTTNGFTVVAAVDFCPRGERALAEAVRLTVDRGGALHAVHVLDRREIDAAAAHRWRDKPQLAVDEAARRLWERIEHVDCAGMHDAEVWVHVRLGSVVNEILDVADAHDVDLVVVGSEAERSWLEHALSRSVSGRVGRRARRAVLLAKPKVPSSRPPGPHVYENAFPDEPPVRSYDVARPVRQGGRTERER